MVDVNRLLAQRMAADRYSEFLASAGVPHSQIALQVMYYLPPDFVSAYEDLWRVALGGDDGGSGQRGDNNKRVADLGRAAGGRQLKGGGGKRRYKKYWTVRNEDALELKDRIDKRLRAMARDLKADLELLDAAVGASRDVARMREERLEGHREAIAQLKGKKTGVACDVCGRFCSSGWHFCANCGNSLRD